MDVTALLDRLLDAHPPATTDPARFLGAQFDLGLAWVHFPVGAGGLGAPPGVQAVVDERLAAAGAPAPAERNPLGHGMAAPTIVTHGTPEQRERWLRPLFTGEEIWCQLFSEPGAGSDLANVGCRAVRDGDEWVVDGQKVWTSGAHLARWGLLVARTDPSAPKHKGLTYFVADMCAPGVDVRPLHQITGEAEFNEVFLTGARIPDDHRLGGEGDGWRVALTTLMNERVAIGGSVAPREATPLGVLLDVWSRSPYRHDPVRRAAVTQLWAEAEVSRLTNLRAQQLREAGDPGPEGSVAKLATAELTKRIYAAAVDLLGPEGQLYPSYARIRPDGETLRRNRDPRKLFLRSRAISIEGGTSEIMRNILGEQVLGLPPEPRVDKGIPWSQARA